MRQSRLLQRALLGCLVAFIAEVPSVLALGVFSQDLSKSRMPFTFENIIVEKFPEQVEFMSSGLNSINFIHFIKAEYKELYLRWMDHSPWCYINESIFPRAIGILQPDNSSNPCDHILCGCLP
jgi:hypothetical protein